MSNAYQINFIFVPQATKLDIGIGKGECIYGMYGFEIETR